MAVRYSFSGVCAMRSWVLMLAALRDSSELLIACSQCADSVLSSVLSTSCPLLEFLHLCCQLCLVSELCFCLTTDAFMPRFLFLNVVELFSFTVQYLAA